MQVSFWGVRGSIPSPATNTEIQRKLKGLVAAAVRAGVTGPKQFERFWEHVPVSEKITFGGNTSCVEVREGKRFVILDAGSGLCPLGHCVMNSGGRGYRSPFHIFLTHFHWDHILGFPFFRPAYQKGNEVVIHSGSRDAGKFFRVQQSIPFFPAGLEYMPASIRFKTIVPGRAVRVGPFTISAVKLYHPGSTLGYGVESRGRRVVYLTDIELLKAPPKAYAGYREFVAGADIAIVDTQYGLLESHQKAEWGHSTAFHWIDLMHDMGVRKMFLFHYEPLRSDVDIAEIISRSAQYLRRLYPRSQMQIHGSYEGQVVDVGRPRA